MSLSIRFSNTAKLQFLACIALAAAITGCTTPSTTTRDFADPSLKGASFANILVVAQGQSLNSRAQFERAVVRDLKKIGVAGSPFYEAVDRKAPINRETVRQALTTGAFDAVLVTRVLDADSALDVGKDIAGARATRRDGRPLDFFRYDYEETPVSGAVSLHLAATLQSDLYRVTDEQKIWTATYTNPDSDSVANFVDDAASEIVKLLDRDRLVASP